MPVLGMAQGLIIPSGTYVRANNANIDLGKNCTNNGTFVVTGGTVVFSGSTQTIDGSTPVEFNNVTVTSSSYTTFNSTQHVNGVLLCDGLVDGNDNLNLISTSTTTALISGAGTGDVIGNVHMQRYIDSTYGYKYFSSPFQGLTVNDFAIYVDLNDTFPNFYSYTENDDGYGWNIYTNTSGALDPLYGYAANLGTSLSTRIMDFVGVVNNYALSVDLYNNNRTYTQGFNLVGNPYPSPIDWNASSGWTRTNIDDAVYFFDNGRTSPYAGTYSSYINGVSSNGIASNIIPSMQGFFVHVSDGAYPVSATFGVDNAVRTNDLSPYFHKPARVSHPVIRLSAGFSNVSDPAVVYFDNNATMAFDKHEDAIKMMNTNPALPNLYVIASDTAKLSIHAMPEPGDSINVVPLGIKTKTKGTIKIKANDITDLPFGLHVYLADARTKVYQDLAANPQYSVYLEEGEYNNRFSLVFSKKDILKDPITIDGFNAYSSDGKIFAGLNLATGDKCEMTLINVEGQVMGKWQLSGYGYHEVPAPVITGIYIVSLQSANGMFSKKLFIGNNK